MEATSAAPEAGDVPSKATDQPARTPGTTASGVNDDEEPDDDDDGGEWIPSDPKLRKAMKRKTS